MTTTCSMRARSSVARPCEEARAARSAAADARISTHNRLMFIQRPVPMMIDSTRLSPRLPGLTPAVQLVERVEASFQVGEQCAVVAAARPLRRDRSQQRRDAPRFSLPIARTFDSRRAVLGVKVIEDLLLEILQPHAHTHAAGAARAEHHVALSELCPLAQEARRFENRGQTMFSAISLRQSKTWSVPGFH